MTRRTGERGRIFPEELGLHVMTPLQMEETWRFCRVKWCRIGERSEGWGATAVHGGAGDCGLERTESVRIA